MQARSNDSHPIIWSIGHLPKVVQASYRRNRSAFVDRFGALIGEEVVQKMDEVQEQLPELCSQMERDPWTLCHGDYRLDNLMFRSNGETVVLDWQGVSLGSARLGSRLFHHYRPRATSPREEEMMLQRYHQGLVDAGVNGYSYEELIEDVSTSKAILAHRMVAGDDLLDTEVESRDGDFIEVLVKRVVGWVDVK